MTGLAEGVETADNAALLCALKCVHAQDFFLKPLTPTDAEAFIIARAPAPISATQNN